MISFQFPIVVFLFITSDVISSIPAGSICTSANSFESSRLPWCILKSQKGNGRSLAAFFYDFYRAVGPRYKPCNLPASLPSPWQLGLQSTVKDICTARRFHAAEERALWTVRSHRPRPVICLGGFTPDNDLLELERRKCFLHFGDFVENCVRIAPCLNSAAASRV